MRARLETMILKKTSGIINHMLRGNFVTLRQLTISDLEHFTRWHSNEEVTRFLGMKPLSNESARNLLESYLDDRNGIYFGILVKDEGKLIGYTYLSNILTSHKVARELGIVIGNPMYWNQGYGTEASRLIIDYGFNVLGLHRIELFVLDFNKRARRVYEKLGFVVEGTQRKARWVNNEWQDVIMMAKLENEKAD